MKRDTGNFISLQSSDYSSRYSWTTNLGEKNDGRVVLHFGTDGQNHVLESVQYGAFITPRLAPHSGKTEDITPKYTAGR